MKIMMDFYLLKKILILLAIALLTIIISLGYGEYQIPPLDVVKTLLALETGNQNYDFAINTLRLPRTIVALLAGIGLAIAGTITQAITRNPLAAPDIIGVNGGASLAAVTLLVIKPHISPIAIPFAAFLGGVVAAVLIYLLAWQGTNSRLKLILVGIGISFIATALTNLMVTFGDINLVSQALVWLTGSVYGRSWQQAQQLAWWILLCVPLVFVMVRELNIFNCSDELACALGMRVDWYRGLLMLLSVALASACVATTGSIGFVGLIAPHIARQSVGSSHQALLPTAALIGGILVIIADLLGRILFSPIELPCGIVTAIIGAPYFLYLLIRNQHFSYQ